MQNIVFISFIINQNMFTIFKSKSLRCPTSISTLVLNILEKCAIRIVDTGIAETLFLTQLIKSKMALGFATNTVTLRRVTTNNHNHLGPETMQAVWHPKNGELVFFGWQVLQRIC